MTRILRILIAVAVTITLAACPMMPTQIRTPIPVHACVVQGGPWTTDGAPGGPAGHVSQMMDAVNAIWQQTNVAFLFLTEPPVIDDPQPPGMALDVPPYVAKGQPGDIRMDDTNGYGSDEAKAAVDACNAAWYPGVAADQQPGFTVVFVRELIWTDGGPTPQSGYSTNLLPLFTAKEAELCQRPYQITKADVAGRWTIIETFDRNYRGLPPNLASVVAHELGHDLLLGHGDGVDNDQNGKWDEYCDPAETNSGSSLMDIYPTSSNTITPLQRERAEAAAAVVPVNNPP
jgi:hypothetical protein